MNFDLTVNLGHLLTIVTVAAGGLWFLSSFRTDIQVIVTRIGQFDAQLGNLDERLNRLAESLSKVGEVLVELARQKERLDGMDRRLEQIEAQAHARLAALADAGVVTPKPRKRSRH